MKISIFGVGYVGLVTGVCFAEMGNTVMCCDIDQKKVDLLKRGQSPIYEPGLSELIESNLYAKRLMFTTEIETTVMSASMIFIAVGTPSDVDGSSDLKYVLSVAKSIGHFINEDKVIIVKSTVPVGTCLKVKTQVLESMKARGVSYQVDVVSNPEFLKEGSAINDCLRPNRVVIGLENKNLKELFLQLYSPFFPKENQAIYFMDLASSELTKYAANAMLATRISFMNEISRLCEQVDANIESVRLGIGSDPRIGSQFLYAGIGYGGSCFPKDVRALLKTAASYDLSFELLQAVELINQKQRHHFTKRILNFFEGDLKGKTFTIWGLAFKPGTDDIREAPSLDVISFLLERGAKIQAFDPEAMIHVQRHFGDKFFDRELHIKYYEDQYEALAGASCLIVVTEWKSFRQPDFERIKKTLDTPVIFDGRNIYDSQQMKEKGFHYFPVGKKITSIKSRLG